MLLTREDFNYNELIRYYLMPMIKTYFEQRELDYKFPYPHPNTTSSITTTNSTDTTLHCHSDIIDITYDIDSANNVAIQVVSEGRTILDVKEHHIVDLKRDSWLKDPLYTHPHETQDFMNKESEFWHDIVEEIYENYQP